MSELRATTAAGPPTPFARRDRELYQTAAIRRFADYWFALPRDGLLPLRSAFHPADIKDLLPLLLLRELTDDGDATYRLVGTAVREFFGSDVTGRDPATVMPAADVERYRWDSRMMITQPCGIYAHLTVETARGRPLTIENLSFPFAPLAPGRHQTLGLLAMLDNARPFDRDDTHLISTDVKQFVDIGNGVPATGPRGGA